MTGTSSTVYLVDDDEKVRAALGRLLASAGYGCRPFANAEEFLQSHDSDIPGCAILDLDLPGMDGFGVQGALAKGATVRPVIFLTGYGDIPASVKAMKSGAVDFLTKPVDATAFLSAVALALERDLEARRTAETRRSVERRIASLTAREREVLTHVLAGRLNKQTAGALGTVEKTIKVHRSRMMKKMGVRTVADLVRLVTPYET